MSNGDQPFDPFGRRDRTIIRPNPGGRRPEPPAAAPPPQAAPVPPPQPAYPPPPAYPPQAAPDTSIRPAVAWPEQARQPGPGAGWGAAPPPGAPAPGGYVDPNNPWGLPPGAAPQPPSGYPAPPAYGQPQSPYPGAQPGMAAPSAGMPPPEALPFARLGLSSPNPILKAGSPLLLMLARLRTALLRIGPAALTETVMHAVRAFEAELGSANVPPDQAQAAKYALCATADDIMQNLPHEDRHLWASGSMLARFYNERTGGIRFFAELDRAKTSPMVNVDLLEFYHACLSLGFEGVHRTGQGGPVMLQQIRRDLYETIRRARTDVPKELSPHWKGQPVDLMRNRFTVPVWAVAAGAGALMLGSFIVLRALLSGSADAVAEEMLALHPLPQEIVLSRPDYVPPPEPPPPPVEQPTTQLERIRGQLKDDIDAGVVTVDQNGSVITVRLRHKELFLSGKAELRDKFDVIVTHVGQTLDKEPGWIKVVGHTDSDKIRSAAFSSNYELSEARAKTVANLITPELADPSRVKVEGKGADEPVAPNTSAEGKALNRRVEILLPRSD